MKKLKIGKFLIKLSLFMFLFQNTYFGWNMYPQSYIEEVTDKIIIITLYIGVGFFLSPLVKIYEEMLRRNY